MAFRLTKTATIAHIVPRAAPRTVVFIDNLRLTCIATEVSSATSTRSHVLIGTGWRTDPTLVAGTTWRQRIPSRLSDMLCRLTSRPFLMVTLIVRESVMERDGGLVWTTVKVFLIGGGCLAWTLPSLVSITRKESSTRQKLLSLISTRLNIQRIRYVTLVAVGDVRVDCHVVSRGSSSHCFIF